MISVSHVAVDNVNVESLNADVEPSPEASAIEADELRFIVNELSLSLDRSVIYSFLAEETGLDEATIYNILEG